MKVRLFFAVAIGAAVSAGASAALINVVDYSTLTTISVEEFDSFADGNYDNIIEGDGIAFGERFYNQSLELDDDFDVISGSPTGGYLSLLAGDPNDNLAVSTITSESTVLAGLGYRGFGVPQAFGEGAVSILFEHDHFEFGISVVAATAGPLQFDFYKRDGTFLHTIVIDDLVDGGYGFRHQFEQYDIAGVVITNHDAGGLAFDAVYYNAVPTPTALTLFAAAALLRRRRR